MIHNKEFALVLGGGAGLGFAHLGVLKFLEENSLKPTCITGASMGALIGGVYALGKSTDEIVEMLEKFNILKIVDLKLFPLAGQAMLRSQKINEYLKSVFGKVKIEDLGIKYGTLAVDSKSGQIVELTNGYLWKAVRASISMPAIFEAFNYGNKNLIDGGIMDNVPTELARKLGAKYVIAINVVDYHKIMLRQKTIIHTLINTLNLMQKELVRVKTSADILVNLSIPSSLFKITKHNGLKAYKIGYEQIKTEYGDTICKALKL